MSFNHLMIDIETLGQNSRSVICSIAAIPFDISTGETGEVFYEKIDIESCVRAGLEIESETLLWWSKQNSLAYMEMLSGKASLSAALFNLRAFVLQLPQHVQVWGNGSRFDLGILRDAFNALKMPVPWNYGNERDVRTLLSLYPPAKEGVPKPANRHFPVDDCQYQIAYCKVAYSKLSPLQPLFNDIVQDRKITDPRPDPLKKPVIVDRECPGCNGIRFDPCPVCYRGPNRAIR